MSSEGLSWTSHALGRSSNRAATSPFPLDSAPSLTLCALGQSTPLLRSRFHLDKLRRFQSQSRQRYPRTATLSSNLRMPSSSFQPRWLTLVTAIHTINTTDQPKIIRKKDRISQNVEADYTTAYHVSPDTAPLRLQPANGSFAAGTGISLFGDFRFLCVSAGTAATFMCPALSIRS